LPRHRIYDGAVTHPRAPPKKFVAERTGIPSIEAAILSTTRTRVKAPMMRSRLSSLVVSFTSGALSTWRGSRTSLLVVEQGPGSAKHASLRPIQRTPRRRSKPW
jgi:hypothetical protein